MNITQWSMFYFDMTFVVIILIIGILYKEIRPQCLVGSSLYLFFALLWHSNIDWSRLY